MTSLVIRFARNQSGATAIEYGLIAGLIAVVIIAAVTLVGTDVSNVFNTIHTKLSPPPPAA
jgi:pilus assembly protein Flp/PilA